MRIEEAVVFLLSTAGYGMSTDTLAREINLQGLPLRKDGKLVTSEQVYACCMRYKEMFVKDGRLIRFDGMKVLWTTDNTKYGDFL